MARCGCNNDQQCLSTNPGNLASYDETGCLYVAEFTPMFGATNQPGAVDLVPLTSGTWTDTGLSVTMPAAGTFEVTADAFAIAHVNISADGGTALVRVFFRLWNVTTNALVTNTQVTMLSVGSNKLGRYQGAGGSTVHANLVITGPTTIKMQVLRIDTPSGAAIASAISNTSLQAEGTSLRYNRLA